MMASSGEIASRVFIEFQVLNEKEFAERVAMWERGKGFFERHRKAFGWTGLDEGTKEAVKEAYLGNPAWAAAGDILLEEPQHARERLVVELDWERCPKTCENFAALISGEKGMSKTRARGAQVPLHYKGTPVFRVEPGVLFQSGDVTRGDGSGGESIWNKRFNDEKEGLRKRHDRRGLVGMANSGKNSNTSQFYVTLAPLPKLDGRHVLFGTVVDGLSAHSLVENADLSTCKVIISDCGLLSNSF